MVLITRGARVWKLLLVKFKHFKLISVIHWIVIQVILYNRLLAEWVEYFVTDVWI